MEFEEGGHVHVIHAWKQAVSRGNSLDMRHIKRPLSIHEVETIGGERSCLACERQNGKPLLSLYLIKAVAAKQE